MMKPSTGYASLFLVAAIAALHVGVQAGGRTQAVERQLYVSVLDAGGVPVRDLQPTDIVVREDGLSREVLRVQRAQAPMQIALLVDNTQAASSDIQNLREGLTAFVRAMATRNEISFITFGDRPTILVDAAPSGVVVQKQGIDRLFAQPGSGSYLLDAIVQTARGFLKREASRPVMVVVTTEGVEFSTDHYEDVLDALEASGTLFHAFVLSRGPRPAGLDSTEVRNRDYVLDRGPRDTGGRRTTLLSSMSLEAEMTKLADELTHQFLVVYARPQTLIPPDRITVSATQAGFDARGTPVRQMQEN